MNSVHFFNSDIFTWNQSYATVDGNRVIDKTQRSSEICTQKFFIDFPTELISFCKICQIKIPEQLECTLYKYNVNDFFAEHTDRKRNDLHMYTVLLLPPCNKKTVNYFKGGKLKIGSIDIDCSSIQTYTYVIFNIDILHELEPILEGTRYVFKSQFDVENNLVVPNTFPFTKEINRNFKIKSSDIIIYDDVDKDTSIDIKNILLKNILNKMKNNDK